MCNFAAQQKLRLFWILMVNTVIVELTVDLTEDGIQQRTGPGPVFHSNPD